MPIHKDFHAMLDSMTGQYCTGDGEETSKTEDAEGYPGKTCRKALSVFYATCKEKGLDYTKPMPVKEHVQAIQDMMRHPDFEKIHNAFLKQYSSDPQFGESRYAEWLKALGLDESASYYDQARARRYPKESFQWAQFLLQFVKEDQDAKYYKVEALFPLESMNGVPYTRDELLQATRTLTGKPSYLNHDPKQELRGIEIVASQYENDTAECLVQILKVSPVIGMIDRKEIVNVSVETEWSHGVVGQGLVFTGLGWLTKDHLPGVPLTRIMPVEHIAESFQVEQVDPLVAGEYFLGFYQDPALFLPEHFRTVWLDQANGVLAVMAKSRADPAKESCQSILFLKSKWQPNTVKDWLTIHSDYVSPASVSASQNAPIGIENMKEEELKELIKSGVAEALKVHEQEDKDKQAQIDRSQKYGIGIKQGGAVTKPGEFSSIPEDQFADPVNFRYPVDAEHCKAALGYFNQPDNRSQYSQEEQNKIMQKIVAACVANGVEVSWQPNDAAYKALPEELKAKCSGYTKESTDAEKLAVAEKKLTDTTSKLTEAERTIEQLRKQLPGGGLLKDPPKMMPVSEHVAVLEGLLSAPMVERSTPGMKRKHEEIRSAILQAKEKLKGTGAS
jgi:hypothetical protein